MEAAAYIDGDLAMAARSQREAAKVPTAAELRAAAGQADQHRRDGQNLGYLWASVGDEAAGYEPRTAAGEAAFEAGAEWLLRLRDAHSRNLSALAALTWVTQGARRPEIGLPVGDTPQETPSLDALEELSGRY